VGDGRTTACGCVHVWHSCMRALLLVLSRPGRARCKLTKARGLPGDPDVAQATVAAERVLQLALVDLRGQAAHVHALLRHLFCAFGEGEQRQGWRRSGAFDAQQRQSTCCLCVVWLSYVSFAFSCICTAAGGPGWCWHGAASARPHNARTKPPRTSPGATRCLEFQELTLELGGRELGRVSKLCDLITRVCAESCRCCVADRIQKRSV